MTMVPVAGADLTPTVTPLGFPAGSDREQLTGFTSQAVITGRIKSFGGTLRGTLYTKDAGYMIPDPDPDTDCGSGRSWS